MHACMQLHAVWSACICMHADRLRCLGLASTAGSPLGRPLRRQEQRGTYMCMQINACIWGVCSPLCIALHPRADARTCLLPKKELCCSVLKPRKETLCLQQETRLLQCAAPTPTVHTPQRSMHACRCIQMHADACMQTHAFNAPVPLFVFAAAIVVIDSTTRVKEGCCRLGGTA